MKKNKIQNSNGIAICDSIVMSVKKKRPNARNFEALIIAVIGYVSVIMSFLGMFSFNYDKTAVVSGAVICAVFYVVLISIKRQALWVIAASLAAFIAAAIKMLGPLTDGFKFVYNIIYQDSFHTEINYYKYLDPSDEVRATTVLFIFAIWLMSFVIFFFTIYRPNMILTLLVTFPIIEIGLYNGIEIPIFWGMMTVGYWFAMFCISMTDFGEYSGGSGGFVRKENTFFPKRHMKLKVTEKSGILVIVIVMLISLVTSSVLTITDYHRSDKINKKRKELSAAFSEFTIENFTESLSKITSVFGLELKQNSNKLGSKDKITYKNVTDIVVDIDAACYDEPIYIKDSTSSIYGNNEWKELGSDAYDTSIFTDFSDYKIFPQDFPLTFSRAVIGNSFIFNMTIESKLKGELNVSPYAADNVNGMTYNRDISVLPLDAEEKELSYRFSPLNADKMANDFIWSDFPISKEWDTIYDVIDNDYDLGWYQQLSAYCHTGNDLTCGFMLPGVRERVTSGIDPHLNVVQLLETRYRDFVYDNYLQVPDNENMEEVSFEFRDYINRARSMTGFAEKLEVLNEMREKIASETQYTLAPGKTPSNRDFVNYFLLENKKGYCIHYATSGVMLARMAGIPARYATGYIVIPEDFNSKNQNPDGSFTINVEDNRSHAWVELYIDGFGWMPYEFTAGYTSLGRPAGDEPPVGTRPPSGTTQSTTRSSTGTATTSATTSSTTATSDSSNKKGGNYGIGFGSGGGDPVPTAYKFSVLLIPLALVGLVLLRRKIVLDLRQKHFTSGSTSSRISYMYNYTEKLLAMRGIKKCSGSFTDHAKEVEERRGGELFNKGDYKKFVDISLKCSFSNKALSAEDIKFCNDFAASLAGSIYNSSGKLRKFWMKFGTVIK